METPEESNRLHQHSLMMEIKREPGQVRTGVGGRIGNKGLIIRRLDYYGNAPCRLLCSTHVKGHRTSSA